MSNTNPFGAEATLSTAAGSVKYFSLPKLIKDGIGDINTLPFSIRVLLEACLRNVDNFIVTADDVNNLANWNAASQPKSKCRSSQAELSCRTSPVCRPSLTWPLCEARWCEWVAIQRRSIRLSRVTWSLTTACRSMNSPTGSLYSATSKLNSNAIWNATSSCAGARSV
jgi:hypothetical protein